MSQQMSWMRDVLVRIRHRDREAVFRYRNEWEGVFELRFNVPFSNEPRPAECRVDLYNLSENSRSRIRRGATVTIEAGYKGDRGVIARGIICRVPPTSITGVDRVTTFHFTEGFDYSDKKDVNITFAVGARASTILRRVANEAGINISQIDLPRDKQYTTGYIADGDALRTLEEVAGDSNASIFFRRGNLIIRSITRGDDERFILSSATGLLGNPRWIESDNYTGWNIQCLLQHRISTASIITLRSQSAEGRFRVKRGLHSFNGSSFITQCEVIG